MLTYLLFVIWFIFLIKGADMLVDGASAIATKMRISHIVVGLTIVAFGTSAPEFVVSMIASIHGNTDIAIWNILWSNIANIFLILGISALIFPIVAPHNTVRKEIPFSLLAAFVLVVMTNDARIDGGSFSGLSKIDGIILLSFFVIFFYYIWELAKNSPDDVWPPQQHQMTFGKSVLLIILGLAGLTIGGKRIVDGAISIATAFHLSESIIWLTIVAIGTSLPELATSALAAYKKQSDIAIGNIVWSNIFNIFWVLWTSALIRPLPFHASSFGDSIMVMVASIFLFICMFIGTRYTLDRRQGALMVVVYVGYILTAVLSS